MFTGLGVTGRQLKRRAKKVGWEKVNVGGYPALIGGQWKLRPDPARRPEVGFTIINSSSNAMAIIMKGYNQNRWVHTVSYTDLSQWIPGGKFPIIVIKAYF